MIYRESSGEGLEFVTSEPAPAVPLGVKFTDFMGPRPAPLKPKISAAPHGLKLGHLRAGAAILGQKHELAVTL